MSKENKKAGSGEKKGTLGRWFSRLFFPNKEMDIYAEEALQSPARMVATSFFLSIGMSEKALFLSLTRQMLFLIPCLIVLPRFFGTLGVWISMPVADTIATVVTAIVLVNQFKKFKHESPN